MPVSVKYTDVLAFPLNWSSANYIFHIAKMKKAETVGNLITALLNTIKCSRDKKFFSDPLNELLNEHILYD